MNRLHFASIVSVVLLATDAVNPGVARADDFACTELIGYSQTMQWYFGGFAEALGRGRTQLRWQGGGSIDLWADPGYAGWSPSGRVNSCAQSESAPDRVLLDVSDDFHSEVGWWVQQINSTLGIIRRRYPSAREIILQPVVGGTGGSKCTIAGKDVRAAFNHPYILQAIQQVVGGNVVHGANPTVRSCGDYADTTGHLTDDAKGPIGVAIAQFYISGQAAAPPPAPPPAAEATPAPSAPAEPSDTPAFCAPGTAPAFVDGFAQLQASLPDVMGGPLNCAHQAGDGTDDVVQQTSTGMALYRASTNTSMFTDGWNHWALTADGVVFWTGDSIDPPQGRP